MTEPAEPFLSAVRAYTAADRRPFFLAGGVSVIFPILSVRVLLGILVTYFRCFPGPVTYLLSRLLFLFF